MNKLWSGGRLALLFIVVTVFLTGCVGVGGGVDSGWTALTIDGSSLYAVRSTGEAVALDLADSGSLIWKYPLVAAASSAPGCGILQSPGSATEESLALGAVYGTPAVSDGLMVFGSSEAKLIALDADTGDPAWSYPVDAAVVGGVAVADGVAYLGTVSGKIYAVDLATHESAWPGPFVTGDRVWSTPVVNGSKLYVASMDHLLYAIDRKTGDSVWSVDLGGAIQGEIALYGDLLLAGGVDRRLYAIDASSGTQLWKTEQLTGWVWGAPLLSGDSVYFTTLDGKVHGHRADNGQVLWSPVVLKGSISAGPVQAGESILVGTDEGLVYLIGTSAGRADVVYGSVQEQQRGGYSSAPAVQDDIVYLGSTMGFIVALDPALRTPELWVYPSSSAE
ncbi:MAG: PQQ-binding-like beta-propeller repeat protein [Anaerolineae bacterium]